MLGCDTQYSDIKIPNPKALQFSYDVKCQATLVVIHLMVISFSFNI